MRDFLLALAELIIAVDNNIGVWAIKGQDRSLFRSPNYFKDNLGLIDDVRKDLDGLIYGGGTPLREVFKLALERYINRIEKYLNAKAFNFIIAGDGYNGEFADII